MLKRVLINSKKIPVPVPIRTLDEALRWVEETLVPLGHTITRVTLNDELLDDSEASVDWAGLKLDDATKLEIQIDSPVDLSIQTLDAMRNLASVILGGLKPLAVECWQSRPTVRPGELDPVANDLELILDLSDHIAALTESMSFDATAILGQALILKRLSVSLAMARSNSDWKACAKLLLNKLEPLLKDLIAEAESLQLRVMAQTVGPSDSVRKRVSQKAPTG